MGIVIMGDLMGAGGSLSVVGVMIMGEGEHGW